MIEPVYELVPTELLGTADADQQWIDHQLDRIAPHRSEMGSAGDEPALRQLVLEMRGAVSPPGRKLKVKRLHPDAIIPAYQTAGAACFDLHALRGIVIGSDAAASIRTGLAFEVPPGYVMHIYSRSGHGFKNGVRLVNSVGVIDSDYRGEVAVGLHNDGLDSFTVMHGDRIAQAMLVPAPQFQITEVTDLSETERGAGGFGSTGK